MDKSAYIGHDSQLAGVEEHRLVGGKGDGMRLFEVRNGLGLEYTVSADRCADISRLSYKGVNCVYFAPCGYAAPSYYEKDGLSFLKTFTAGFLTTCGLTAAGSPCTDDGEELPLHGSISHQPAENIYSYCNDKSVVVKAIVNEARLFGHKLKLVREISCSTEENLFTITDTVENYGDTISPLMLLYHINVGYPLLSENAVLNIPSYKVTPRNERAAEDLDAWNKVLPPTPGFVEQCYYHEFKDEGKAAIYNPDLGFGLTVSFDPSEFDYFTQWKMMGYRDYVIGLEPGNCNPDGRDRMRADGKLKFIAPGEKKTYRVNFRFFDAEKNR